MDLTNIGHESWLIETDDIAILVDPIFAPSFGTQAERRFRIVPPRKLKLSLLPQISAVVLTTEHIQHFCLRSLRALKEVQNGDPTSVYLPPLFPEAAFQAIERLGYQCIRIDPGSSKYISALRIRFYQPTSDVPFWDSRVASLYVQYKDDAIFIQSDTAISGLFYSEVRSKQVVAPTIVVVTNNFQRSANGKTVGLDNLLPISDPKYSRAAGLRLLDALVAEPIRKLGYVPDIVIAGNGYSAPANAIDHIWTNEHLAIKAEQLSLQGTVAAASPAKKFSTKRENSVSPPHWIFQQEYRNSEQHDPNEYDRPQYPGRLSPKKIIAFLNEMARAWIITECGQPLLAQHEYLGRPIGSIRFALCLQSNRRWTNFLLDISTVEFAKSNETELIKKIPFGITCDYDGFCQLLNGDVQIWELMNSDASQWYVCDRYKSPLAFMLEYFSEHVDQARARSFYEKSLSVDLSI